MGKEPYIPKMRMQDAVIRRKIQWIMAKMCIRDRAQGEAEMDEEGKQTMRVLARNMVFLMKSIALGKEMFGLPEKEEQVATHFIR